MKTSMGIAALLMGFSVLLSRFMGLIRDKVISWQFGAGGDADIYFAAFVIPDFINYLLAGGYLSITLIPFLAEKFQKEEECESGEEKLAVKDSWHFFGTVFSWAALAITSLTVLAFIFAPQLTQIIAPGFDEGQHARLAYFLRIILFAQVFFLLGACFSSILYVRKQFLVPALMPIIYNGFILLFGTLFPLLGLGEGMEGFCYGVLLGAFMGAFLLPWYAVYKGGLEWNFSLKHKDFKKFLIIALPLMIGQSVVVLDEQFVRIFGSMAGDGAVSLLNYARRIMLVPVGVVAQAAALASFPFLASLLARNEVEQFNQSLQKALNSSLLLIIPISAFMIMQSENIIGFIFEGGVFSEEDTRVATPLLQIMLISVPFWAIQQIVGRAFYAKQDTVTPAVVGTIATFAVVPLYYYFTPIYGAFFVALMTSVSVITYTLLLVLVWHKKSDSDLLLQSTKMFLRSLFLVLPPTFFSLYLTQRFALYFVDFSPLLRQFTELCVSGIIFGMLWLLLVYNLQKEDFLSLIQPFLRKINRRQV